MYGHIEINEVSDNSFIVKNNNNLKYIKMGTKEKDFLCEVLQNNATPESIEEIPSVLGQEEKKYLYNKFIEWGFLNTEKGKNSDNRIIKKLLNINISAIKVFCIDIDKKLNNLISIINIFCNKWLVFLYVVLFTSGCVLLSQVNVDKLDVENITLNSNYIVLIILIIGTTFIHEMSHTAVCKYFGGSVREVGIMLFYFTPVIYCDVSDVYLFKEKYKKVLVTSAGIISQLVLSSIAIVINYLLGYFNNSSDILFYYAVSMIGISIFNLIPFVKLDGYWILSHALGIDNLRSKSIKYFINMFFTKNIEVYESKEKAILFSFGLCSIIFAPLFWGYSIFLINRTVYNLIGNSSVYISGLFILILIIYYTKKLKKYFVID